jgi:hypothetical protein
MNTFRPVMKTCGVIMKWWGCKPFETNAVIVHHFWKKLRKTNALSIVSRHNFKWFTSLSFYYHPECFHLISKVFMTGLKVFIRVMKLFSNCSKTQQINNWKRGCMANSLCQYGPIGGFDLTIQWISDLCHLMVASYITQGMSEFQHIKI